VSKRARLARPKPDRTAPPPWLATAAWIGGLIVATTIVWLFMNGYDRTL
jgi:hypothetical protein